MGLQLGSVFIALGVKPENIGAFQNWMNHVKQTTIGAKQGAAGISTFEKSTKGMGRSLKDVIGPLNVARLQIVGFYAAATMAAKKTSDVAAGLLKFERLTGISAQALQVWQQRAAAAGVSAEDVEHSIKQLQRNALNVQLGKGDRSPWAILGIDPYADTSTMIKQLETNIKSFSPAMQAKLTTELGLSEDFLNFMLRMRSLPPPDKSLILSDKELAELEKYNTKFNVTWDNGKRALQKFGYAMLPIAKFLTDFTNRLARGLAQVSKALDFLSTDFDKILPWIVGLGIAVTATFSPMLALFGTLLLLFDDVMGWSNGEASLLGDVIGPFTEWKDTLADIKKFLKDIIDTCKELANGALEKVANLFTEVGLADGATNENTTQGLGSKAMRGLKWLWNAQGQMTHGLSTGNWPEQWGSTSPAPQVNITNNFNGNVDANKVIDNVGESASKGVSAVYSTMPQPAK